MLSLILFALVVPYLVPTAIAAYRDHRDARAIVLINVLLGWTLIGWVVALIWALSGESNPRQIATAGDRVQRDGLRLEGRDPRFDKD